MVDCILALLAAAGTSSPSPVYTLDVHFVCVYGA